MDNRKKAKAPETPEPPQIMYPGSAEERIKKKRPRETDDKKNKSGKN